MTNPPDMSTLRAEIDRIDREMAALVARRAGLAALVADAKRAAGDTGFGWRPAREVSVLRMVREAQPDLDPWLAATVWRAMIAWNLAAQGGMSVVSLPECIAEARLAFGAAQGVSTVADARTALDHVRTSPNAVAVVPLTGGSGEPWWAILSEPAYDGMFVCAASPIVHAGGLPPAVCIAAINPEEAGEDTSLLVASAGMDLPADAQELASRQGARLIALPRFVSPEAARTLDLSALGSFALA